MLETNYLEYPASIQEAMGMQVDWAEEVVSQPEEEEELVPETPKDPEDQDTEQEAPGQEEEQTEEPK